MAQQDFEIISIGYLVFDILFGASQLFFSSSSERFHCAGKCKSIIIPKVSHKLSRSFCKTNKKKHLRSHVRILGPMGRLKTPISYHIVVKTECKREEQNRPKS